MKEAADTTQNFDAKTCHNWTARRQWITPQGPNPRGKARRYSLVHVIEAAFRAERGGDRADE